MLPLHRFPPGLLGFEPLAGPIVEEALGLPQRRLDSAAVIFRGFDHRVLELAEPRLESVDFDADPFPQGHGLKLRARLGESRGILVGLLVGFLFSLFVELPGFPPRLLGILELFLQVVEDLLLVGLARLFVGVLHFGVRGLKRAGPPLAGLFVVHVLPCGALG